MVRRIADALDPPVARVGQYRSFTPADVERVRKALKAGRRKRAA